MVLDIVLGTLLGFLSGLGVGGGSLLVLWLTLVQGMAPAGARTINLLFFLPSAVISLMFRWKQGDLPVRKIIPAIISGVLSAALFTVWGQKLDVTVLKKGFGVLLLATGFREILYRPKK